MNDPSVRTRKYPAAAGVLVLLMTIGAVAVLQAQPVPCGPAPDMTSTCIEACVICDIDGYTGINNDTDVGQAPPGFCTNVVHHMQWIAFIAGSTDLTINVSVSNCNTGAGLEVGIYESLGCEIFKLVSNCNGGIAEGQTGVFTNTEPLVIGQYYYFVMDGNFNDVCNYTIHVTNGTTMVPPLPAAGAVQGFSELCQSETAIYSIPEIVGANFYEWTLNGLHVGDGPETEITFPDAGTYELCVTAFNVCDTVPPSCKTVQVFATQLTNLSAEICNGECIEVADTLLCGPGNYSFTLTSIHGCDSIVNISIAVLPPVSVDLEATICSTDSLYVGDTWYFPPGQYTEVLAAANGCDSIINLTLHAIVCEITGRIDVQPVLCHGGATGALDFSVLGGTPPMAYSWQRLGGIPSGSGVVPGLNTPESIPNLPAGTYLITIEDTYGNDVVLTANITEPPPLMVTLLSSDQNGYPISCYGGQDGTLTALPQGGAPGYGYAWSNGGSGPVIEGLASGDYTVNVVDAVGCTLEAQITLAEPPALVFSALFADPGCEGYYTGSASAQSINGGVAPYLVALSGDDFGGETAFDGLAEGSYTLTVMDANGCTADTSVVLTAARIPLLEVGGDIELKLGYSEQFQVYVDLVPQVIEWTPAEGLSCTDCLEPVVTPYRTAVYTLAVTSEDGCVTADSLIVRVLKSRDVYVPNAFSPNNDGVNDKFTIFAGKGVRQIKKLQVFSRWGELVFEQSDFPANDPGYGWDGTFLGKQMQAGVFAWWAEVEFLDGVSTLEKGDVMIMR